MVELLPSMHTALGFNPCANNKKKKVVTTGTISESVHRPLPGWSHELSAYPGCGAEGRMGQLHARVCKQRMPTPTCLGLSVGQSPGYLAEEWQDSNPGVSNPD